MFSFFVSCGFKNSDVDKHSIENQKRIDSVDFDTNDAINSTSRFGDSVVKVGLSGSIKFCTASVLGRRFVLSAAHCEVGAREEFLARGVPLAKGWATSHVMPYSGQDIPIDPDSSILHPQADLMVLVLQQDLNLRRGWFCIDKPSGIVMNNQYAFLGYGNHAPPFPQDRILGGIFGLKINTPSIRSFDSSNSFQVSGTTGIVRGDSGGPFFRQVGAQLRQMGLLTLKRNADLSQFLNITKYVDWIQDIVHAHGGQSILCNHSSKSRRESYQAKKRKYSSYSGQNSRTN